MSLNYLYRTDLMRSRKVDKAIKGFKSACHQSFKTQEEAGRFMTRLGIR